jgi:hypothetical protein|nr:MAG TPA: hypothetical protein [Caudoviricetes sp.]DAP75785.1 MAG TPA: hypothetical protein [Caudoviricetes sp.]
MDEKKKKDIPQEVITPKRKYFMPESGKVVEAESLEQAIQEDKNEQKENK